MLEDSDSDLESLFNPPPIPDQIKKKSENLFAGFSSSDDDDDLFSTTTKSSKKPEPQTKKSGGLFDDDSDSDLDDLFSGKKWLLHSANQAIFIICDTDVDLWITQIVIIQIQPKWSPCGPCHFDELFLWLA